ncbi:MAG: universal stress protein [Haloarculaceae archaeon]
MYETILAPTDGSDHARRAAAHAGALAAAFNADVHLLAVTDIQSAAGPFSAGGVDSEYRDRFENQARDWLTGTEGAVTDDVGRHTALREGKPAQTIAEYTSEVGADLITMGTHGRSGVSRYVLGSVTERVLRLADAPVFTVGAEDRTDPGAPIEDVLVPTDGSERAATAIEHGMAFAGIDGARIHAVSVLDDSLGLEDPAPLEDEVRGKMEEEAHTATQRVADAAAAAGLEAVVELRRGNPAAELLAYVDDAGIDVVAMGTQGRTGLNRYLLGSTTERVVRHAPVPVIAVHGREGE